MLQGFYQWEDATLEIDLSGAESLAGADVVVSLTQGAVALDYTGDDLSIDVEAGIVSLTLPQADTGKFQPGRCTVQVNVKYPEGRDPSRQASLAVFANTYQEAM